MTNNDSVFDFCKNVYYSAFEKSYSDYLEGKKPTKQRSSEAERYAQKLSIRIALTDGVTKFPDVDIAQIWKCVYKVHLFRKTGLSVDEETIEKVISADQSWKKSSGHAFEELIKEISSLSLADTNIRIVLQKDLNILIKSGELKNEPRDIAWLEKQIETSIFDCSNIYLTNSEQ